MISSALAAVALLPSVSHRPEPASSAAAVGRRAALGVSVAAAAAAPSRAAAEGLSYSDGYTSAAGGWTAHEGPFDASYFRDFQDSKTAPGFKYKFLREGGGEKPQPFQKVFVHYTGYLTDGTRFDTSYKPSYKADLKGAEEPFGFRLNKGKVISGWEGIVSGMTVGQRVVVYIPPEYAYGEQGAGSKIPPNSPLVFYMELVKLGNIKGDKPRVGAGFTS